MISRKYDKRIELKSLNSVADGFGGFTLAEVFVAKKWANIETKNSFRTTTEGKIENYQTILISFRGVGLTLNEKANFFTYKNKKYVINRIDNVDLTGIDLTAYCTETNG